MIKRTTIPNPCWKNLLEEKRDHSVPCDYCKRSVKPRDRVISSNGDRYHAYCFYKRLKRLLKEKELTDSNHLKIIKYLQKAHKKRIIKIENFRKVKQIFVDKYPEMILEEL